MPRPSSDVPDPRRVELVERVVANVLSRITQGTFVLPSMPAAAFDCLELLRQPDFSVTDATSVIEDDVALAARVLAVTNSAAFGGRAKVRSIGKAVARLGAANLRLVLFEAMAIPIYDSKDPRIRQACLAIWHHSRAVADCARRLAVVTNAGDPGEAYLAGLLHDIGKPIIASLLVGAEHRIIGRQTGFWLEAETWLDVVQGAHRAAGVALAREWKLPEAVLATAANCSTYEDGAPRSVSNCVRLANAIAKKAGVYVGRSDPAEVADLVLAGQVLLALDDTQLDRVRTAMQAATAPPE